MAKSGHDPGAFKAFRINASIAVLAEDRCDVTVPIRLVPPQQLVSRHFSGRKAIFQCIEKMCLIGD